MLGVLGWFMALAVTLALLLGVERVSTAAIDDARATTAADAAALAGAAAGEGAAADAASRNSGQMVSIVERGMVTTVVVRVGSATATAHAERVLVPVG